MISGKQNFRKAELVLYRLFFIIYSIPFIVPPLSVLHFYNGGRKIKENNNRRDTC